MKVWLVVGWLSIINLWAFAAFGIDKRRSIRGDWRLPERHLLLLAMLGGWGGAKIGQRLFRHKTRKEPFRTALNLAVIAPLLVVLVVLTPLGPALGQAIARAISDGLAAAFAPEPLPDDANRFPHRFGPDSGD